MAVGASTLALWLGCRRELDRASWIAGSVCMAGAITGMHYTGMYAMEIASGIDYEPGWMALSVLIAVAGSATALRSGFDLRRTPMRARLWRKSAAVLFMGALPACITRAWRAPSFRATARATPRAAWIRCG